MWTKAKTGNGYYIERSADDLFNFVKPNRNEPWSDKFVTFWTSHKDGVIGIQLRHSDYDNLLPSPVLEEPYALSFITVFDTNWQLVWDKPVAGNIDNRDYELILTQLKAGKEAA